jgi:hypothetical protein
MDDSFGVISGLDMIKKGNNKHVLDLLSEKKIKLGKINFIIIKINKIIIII